MNELYQQMLAIGYGVWRKRWYVVGTAYLVCLVGWGIVARIPDSYSSSTRIYVDTETTLRPLMRGLAVDVDLMQQVDLMRHTLVSRPNLETVVRRTDMDLLIGDGGGEMEDLIKQLEKSIIIRNQGINLFWLEYESGNPNLSDKENAALAKRVVQNLLTIFVEGNLGQNRQDLAGARRFIDDQIAHFERQLDEAERRKAEFERRNMGLMPGESNYFQRVQNLRREHNETDAKLQEATLVRDEYKRQLEEVPPFVMSSGQFGPAFGSGGGQFSSVLPQRIGALEQQMDLLKTRGYTDQHPDVVITQRQIDALREQLVQEQQAYVEQMELADQNPTIIPAGNRAPNPVYEQVKIRLVEAETNLASLNGRRAQQQLAMKELEDKAKTIPLIEAEMTRLNRDYDVIKRNYQELLERRESARFSQDLDTKGDSVQFQVIDPPSDPLVPSNPNRPLLITAVLLAGLGAGTVLALILSQLKPTYITVQSLRDQYALPVLGSISAVVSDQDRRQRMIRVGIFTFTFFGLIVSYAAILAVEVFRGSLV